MIDTIPNIDTLPSIDTFPPLMDKPGPELPMDSGVPDRIDGAPTWCWPTF